MAIKTEKQEQYYEFLIELRDSGVTNMWGAAPYLQAAFPHLTENEARTVLVEWIDSFSKKEG